MEEPFEAFFSLYGRLPLFCADSSLDSQAGTCNGDSGGPALVRFVWVLDVTKRFIVFKLSHQFVLYTCSKIDRRIVDFVGSLWMDFIGSFSLVWSRVIPVVVSLKHSRIFTTLLEIKRWAVNQFRIVMCFCLSMPMCPAKVRLLTLPQLSLSSLTVLSQVLLSFSQLSLSAMIFSDSAMDQEWDKGRDCYTVEASVCVPAPLVPLVSLLHNLWRRGPEEDQWWGENRREEMSSSALSPALVVSLEFVFSYLRRGHTNKKKRCRSGGEKKL